MFLKSEFSNRLIQISLFSALVYYITTYPVVFEKARKYFPVKFKKTHHLLIFHTFVFAVLMYVLTYFVFDPLVRVVEGANGDDGDGDGSDDGDGDGADGFCNGQPLPEINNGYYSQPTKSSGGLGLGNFEHYHSFLVCNEKYTPTSGHRDYYKCGENGWEHQGNKGECILTSEKEEEDLQKAKQNQQLRADAQRRGEADAAARANREKNHINDAGDIYTTVKNLSDWSKCNIPVNWPKIGRSTYSGLYTRFWIPQFTLPTSAHIDRNNILYYCAKRYGKNTLSDLEDPMRSKCMDDISDAITTTTLPLNEECDPDARYDEN